MSARAWPENEGCGGDGYHDIVDDFGGVIGPRPCRGCPDCSPASDRPSESAQAAMKAERRHLTALLAAGDTEAYLAVVAPDLDEQAKDAHEQMKEQLGL